MAKFRTKRVLVEAMQVPQHKTHESFGPWAELFVWLGSGGPWRLSCDSMIEIVHPLGGIMVAHGGYWIVRQRGMLLPYREDHFKELYELVE